MDDQAIVIPNRTPELSAALPFDAAHAALGNCFKRGGGPAFLEQVRQIVDNPYEPADSKGLKRINPYILSAGVVVVVGVLVFIYFTIMG